MKFTLLDLWNHMGLFARLVAGVLLVLSIASLFVAVDRVIAFALARRASRRFAAKLEPILAAGEIDKAAALTLEQDIGYLGRVVVAGLRAYRTAPCREPDLLLDTVARALERQSAREVQGLRKGQGLLATVSTTAPFIGLLGTVMGIVTAFQRMAASGSGGLETVSAGIAEALVTTAFGLLVAIPAVMFFNYVQGWVDARSVDMAESSNELLDLVSRARYLPRSSEDTEEPGED